MNFYWVIVAFSVIGIIMTLWGIGMVSIALFVPEFRSTTLFTRRQNGRLDASNDNR